MERVQLLSDKKIQSQVHECRIETALKTLIEGIRITESLMVRIGQSYSFVTDKEVKSLVTQKVSPLAASKQLKRIPYTTYDTIL